ncbi:MAG: ABC transporter permease [Candidatus Omnitrophota bacterium]|nr:ABC transporter permease [Candidatus Omnitrophota bacterium]MDZ4241536.1 ABC transporter permease [Candidatus Omnitrophota bacterium]
MNYENWISYRYLIASKGRFLTFLNFISIAGVAVGVAALIVVTGIMTGFGNNLRNKIIGTTPHVAIEKETGIRDYEAVMRQVRGLAGVKGVSGYIQGNIFIEEEGQALGLVIRGINPSTEPQVTQVQEYVVEGDLAGLSKGGIVIGNELARYFGYSLGDKVTLIAPGSGMAGRGWRFELPITGIFNTGMVDYDMKLVVVDLKKAQEILNIPSDKVSGIGVKIDNPYDAREVKQAVYDALGYSFLVKTWIDVNRNLFEALFLEKWGLFIVLTLMVLVASFNIVSTLVVTVTSKIHDIGILQSFGVPQKSIRSIFTKQGILIGVLGTFWGVVSGVGLSYLLRTYIKVPAEIYSIDHVPVELQLSDLLAIVTAALVISYVASIYPAAKAAQLQPVEALRYE